MSTRKNGREDYIQADYLLIASSVLGSGSEKIKVANAW